MKKTRILSLLLGLSLLCTLIVPATVYADDPTVDSGMKISKTATANDDGTYTITLEAFATGAQTTSTVTKDIPTDIILVLDQSGSMADNIGTVTYKAYTENDTQNKRNYEKRHNGDGDANLWHKLEDGSYVSVSVMKTTTYKALDSLVNYETYWGSLTDDCYYYYANNLYEKVGEEYKKVTLTEQESGPWYDKTYTYTYTFSDSTSISSTGRGSNPDLGSHAPLYTPVEHGNDTVYTYTYTDATGAVKTIGTSIGANTQFTPAFYRRSTSTSGGGSRLNALKSAANAFIGAVAEKAAGADKTIGTDDDVEHRIAVVGFASKSGNGNNTELLSITGRNSGSVGVAYNSITNQNLKDVLQSMDTQGGQNMVNAAITALAANGATRTDLGMDMAQRILNANPVPAGETRNRVVIVFTDGSPTDLSGFEMDVANAAINKANAIKNSGATVYSIGIFSGADASSAGTKPSGDLGKGSSQLTAACNWFMQQVSSNNGTPRYPSYYLSAGDADSLNSIFQQISDQIETGGSSSTLTSDAVVKDIISPQFTLPEGANVSSITLETYRCTGKNGSDYTWSKNTDAMGAKASISGDQVNVTGFNFSENYVGTVTENGSISYRGHKLVISFKVKPKAGFLGGNDVITNSSAGIYENGSAQTPVMTFEQPTVNVPIKDVTVTAEDKNVYLLGGVTADQLKNGATVKVGDVKLDLSKADQNYGLESWQTEYVNITVEVKDKDGNVIPADGLKDLTDDTTYTVEVTVAPKTPGSENSKGAPATVKTGQNNPANINVFKPELTFKDSQIDLGDTANYEKQNHGTNFEVWKHGEIVADSAIMIGTKPELALSYDPEEAAFTQDTPVKVTVKIGETDVTEKTKFKHEGCNFEGCKWGQDEFKDCHFIVHVKSFDLTIKKKGWEKIDENQSFVFKVTKDDDPAFSMDVVIQGNSSVTIKDLKPGTYTVTEETDWSWRYTLADVSQQVNPATATEKDENDAVLVTFTNTREKIKWLNGGAWCKNLWGTSTASKSN